MAEAALPVGSHHGRGALLACAAGVTFSFYGLLYRLLESAGAWHIIMWRTLGIVPLVLVAMYLVNGRNLWHVAAQGWRAGLMAALPLAGAQICINLAFAQTTVGAVLFVTALAPFGTAVCAWLVLGEHIRKRTAFGMAVALAGVALVAGSGIAEGRMLGFTLAMGAVLLIVVYNLMLRANRDIEMLPSVAYSVVITACVSGAVLWANGAEFLLPARDLLIIQLMGAGSLGAGLVLFTLATRLRPVAELSLFAQLEMVLTPMWVWLGVGEIPAPTALVGGGLIVLALVIALAPERS